MKKVVVFTCLVLILAFFYWSLFPLINVGDNMVAKEISGFLRGYTPTFAAVLTILFLGGRGDLKKYWKTIFTFKIPTKAVLAVFLIPLLINALVVLVSVLFWDGRLTFAELNIPKFLAIYFIFIFLDGPLGEELGWRGYFLPQLLKKFNPLVSSLIVGVVMFFWHIIIFAADGPELDFDFITKYFISILGIAMIFTFVYLKYSKLPLVAVLLHTSVNYFIYLRNSLFQELKETSIDNIAYVAIVVIMAIALFLSLKKNG